MTKSETLILITAFLGCAQFSVGQEQDGWELRKQKNGIYVYSKETGTSSFNIFRAETTFTGSLETFVAALQDLPAMPEWSDNVKYVKILETEGDSVLIYYLAASAPFPFSDRDGIYKNSYHWDSEQQCLTVKINILEDYLPLNPDLVRVKGQGFWEVKLLADDKLGITFQMLVDPGGSIPAWLSNMFTDEIPYHSLQKFRDIMMVKPQYQNRKFEFLE